LAAVESVDTIERKSLLIMEGFLDGISGLCYVKGIGVGRSVSRDLEVEVRQPAQQCYYTESGEFVFYNSRTERYLVNDELRGAKSSRGQTFVPIEEQVQPCFQEMVLTVGYSGGDAFLELIIATKEPVPMFCFRKQNATGGWQRLFGVASFKP